MNTLVSEGQALASALSTSGIPDDVTAIVCPPFTHLSSIIAATSNSPIAVGGQDCSPYDYGAYTGQISAEVLKEIGAEYVILGHSERRNHQGENDEIVREKVKNAVRNGIKPIYCCGETIMMRESGIYIDYVIDQVKTALFKFDPDQIEEVVIAYEPIWAIGTGKTASPEQAQEMHAAIRNAWSDHYGAESADNLSILYGGSCKPANAQEIFSQPDVDGGLIGGASLKADSFVAICNSY